LAVGRLIQAGPFACEMHNVTPKSTSDRAGPPPSAVLETCLYVEDLERARDFYVGLFGYPVMEFDERFCGLNVGAGQVLILFVRGSNPQGTVLPHGIIPSHDGSGRSHIAFSTPTDSLACWQARLRERGIAVESIINWPTGGTSVYFRDPDGHLLELVTPGTWPNY